MFDPNVFEMRKAGGALWAATSTVVASSSFILCMSFQSWQTHYPQHSCCRTLSNFKRDFAAGRRTRVWDYFEPSEVLAHSNTCAAGLWPGWQNPGRQAGRKISGFAGGEQRRNRGSTFEHDTRFTQRCAPQTHSHHSIGKGRSLARPRLPARSPLALRAARRSLARA